MQGGVPDQGLEASFQLLEGHLLAMRGEEAQEAVAQERTRLMPLHRLEGLPDLLGPHREDGSVVHIKLHEVIEAYPVHVLAGLAKLRVFHLVCHVFDLELCGEVAQGAHEVVDLLDGDHAVQHTGLCRVLVLGPDLGVVEVVLHIREELALLPTIHQLHERLDAGAAHDACARHWLRVDLPLVNCQVVAPTSEGVRALVVHRDGRDLPGVCDESHALVWVPIERQLHQAQDLLMSGIKHELVLIVDLLLTLYLFVDGCDPSNGAAVGGRKRRLSAGPVHGVPDLELVLVIHGEHLLVVTFATKRVPNATSGPCLLFHDSVRGHNLESTKL
mmetsp:Transcript_38894/g.82799  ORF Transcript_38894/g.82799 Transcript_38894/m.82799 type:complete len:330 (+) Transcript_38894:255-1244(+)